MSLAEKLFGSFSDRELKKINPITKKVLALETKYQPMSDAELQAQTPALKERLANGETLDDILPDAFAVCREAAWRVLGMKHFPVQIMGGIAVASEHRINRIWRDLRVDRISGGTDEMIYPTPRVFTVGLNVNF